MHAYVNSTDACAVRPVKRAYDTQRICPCCQSMHDCVGMHTCARAFMRATFIRMRISKCGDRYADTQIRRYADTQICRYAGTQIRRYADTQIRRYADTQIRRYADTQIRRYADTLVRRCAQRHADARGDTATRTYAGEQLRRYELRACRVELVLSEMRHCHSFAACARSVRARMWRAISDKSVGRSFASARVRLVFVRLRLCVRTCKPPS
jgi:hypothetical protein